MANDKKFIVKNGLLTPQNVVVGSNNDTGEKLQVTGSSKLSGQVTISQSNFGIPSLSVTQSGGYLFSPVIAEFIGDSDSLQIINSGVGDYKLVNSQQNNGITFTDGSAGISLLYNNAVRLAISSSGNDFKGLSTTTIDGNRIITVADEGPGNGFDADTVDGLEGSQFVRSDVDDIMAGNYTIQQNLTISGDLTVSGTTTTVNTETVLIADNIITLNSNYTGSTPTEDSGFEVERGTLNNSSIVWDETNDYFRINSAGTNLGRIITTADEGSGNGFDADTVDGLEGSQFLRSDVDDTAAGNITIEKVLTVGNNTGGAEIQFNGVGNNRVLYSQSGEIGFLNASLNYAAKSDANGNWIVENDVESRDVEASRNVTAGAAITAQTNITATAGNISATAGSVSAGTTVTAGTDVIGQRFVDADNNSYFANPAGTSTFNDLGIDDDLFHNGDTDTKITFTTATISLDTDGTTRLVANNSGVFIEDLVASGDITADTFTAITEMQSPIFYDSDNRTYYGDFAGTSQMSRIDIDDYIRHRGDTNNYIGFPSADSQTFVTGGVERLEIDNAGVSSKVAFDSLVSITAPIYYDADDNNFYGNFATTSRVNDISLVGEIIHDGDTNTYIHFNAADSFQVVAGSVGIFTANSSTVDVDGDLNVTGDITATDGTFNDVYASVFYDADNSTFFLDPSSATLSLNANGEVRTDYAVSVRDVDGAGNVTPGTNEARLSGYGLIGNRGTVYVTNAGGDVQIGTGTNHNQNPGLTVSDTRVTSTRNVYAPRYYDSNDENFYGDFASTSRINDISLVGEIIHDGDTNTYIHFNGADSFQVVAGATGIFTATSTTVTVDGDLTVTGTITGVDGTFSGDVTANNVTATTAVYSPVYYDADDNNYYGDFASTSVLNKVSIDDYVIHNGDTNTYFGFNAADSFEIVTAGTQKVLVDNTYVTTSIPVFAPSVYAERFYDSNNLLFYGDFASTSRMNDISLVGEIIADGDTDTYLQFHADNQFRVVTGGSERLEVSTYTRATGSVRSPIFYDLDNVAYYGNFAGTSQMNRIDIDDYVRHRGDTNTYIGFPSADNFRVVTGGANRFNVDTDSADFTVDVYAPKFIDSNNNSYYLDPANASLSATLNGAVRIGAITNNSRWSDNSGNGGIALLSHADENSTSNPTIAISGADGDYSLMYMNRIGAGPNPFDNGNRFIHFYTNGVDGIKLSGDSSGNLYMITKSGMQYGTYTSGGNPVFVTDDSGNALVGQSSVSYTSTDNSSVTAGRTITDNKLHVNGSIQLAGNNDAIVFGRGTSTFLMDEELGFGWGGGFYMDEGTTVKIRNDKDLSTGGDMYAGRFYDDDNNAYYADPAGDSQFNTVDIDDYVRHRGDTNTYIGFPANDQVRIATNNTERVLVTNSQTKIRQKTFIYGPEEALVIQKQSNGNGVKIIMSDNLVSEGSYGQSGSIEFFHSDAAVTPGGEAAFLFRTTENVSHFVFGSDSDGSGTTAANHAAILPQTNNTGYIGNTNRRWQYVYGGTANFSGNATAANMYAARYYDSNDDNYYGDFASTSVMNQILLRNSEPLRFSTTTTALFDHEGNATPVAFRMNKGGTSNSDDTSYGVLQLSRTNHTNASTDVGAGLYFNLKDNNGTLREYAGISGNKTVAGASGGRLIFRTYGRNARGYFDFDKFEHVSSMRAPIFYDRDDPAFYGNFAGTSVMARIELPQNPVGTTYAGVSTQPTYYIGQTNGDSDRWKIYGESPSGSNTGNLILQSEDDYDGNESIRMRFKRTYSPYNTRDNLIAYFDRIESPTSFRAPIFYDRDDPNYYGDFAGNSRMNTIFANRIYPAYDNDTSIYLDYPSGNYGSIQVNGNGKGGWEGYSINGRYVLMSADNNQVGLYNDLDNEWMFYASRNAGIDFYYNNNKQLETENGYALATNQMRAPVYYAPDSTTYYLDLDNGNTNRALNIGGVINREGFTNDSGANNRFLTGQDLNHWIWNTATDWGIFWATTGSPAYSHFSSGNANELVFVGDGNVRASIDLDDGNAHFAGDVSASDFLIDGGNEGISLNPAYGSGGADLVLFDATEYFEKRVTNSLKGIEDSLTGTTSEFVRTTDGPFAGSYVLQSSGYRTFYSDYIPVAPGEQIYGEISVKYISGSGGLLYYGVERFDSQKRPIAGNTGTTYFVVSGANYTGSNWNTYRGHTTIPTSHTPYNGSDGGGVYYVRIRILMNYSGGGALRQFGGIMLKRRNVESNLLADDVTADQVIARQFQDRDDTAYYLEPANASRSGRFRGEIFIGPNQTWGDYIQIGGNGREYINNTTVASVVTTDGNLHIDAASGHSTYINYYDGDNIYFGNGNDAAHSRWESNGDLYIGGGGATAESGFKLDVNGNIQARGNLRAHRFEDRDDPTNRYVDPASTSEINNINIRGKAIFTGRTTDSGGSSSYVNDALRLDEYLKNVAAEFHSGNDQPVTLYFRSGVNAPSDFAYITYDPDYDNSGENGALVLGSENDGTGSSDYIRLQARTVVDSDSISSDNTMIMEWKYQDGQRAYLNTDRFQHNTEIRAPIFRDTDNPTTWFLNPAGTSFLNVVNVNRLDMRDRGDFITFYGDDSDYHGIASRNNAGSISDDIRINSYHRVFLNLDSNNNNNSDTTGLYIGQHGLGTGSISGWAFNAMADGNTYAQTSFRAPRFYDRDDPAYFGDFASTSRLNLLNVNAIKDDSSPEYGGLYFDQAGHNYVASDTSSTGNRGQIINQGLAIVSGYSTGSNRPHTYDITASFNLGGRAFEISADWVSPTGTPLKVRSLRDCCQGWSPWVDIATSTRGFSNTVDLRAPRFYDLDDPAFYGDFASQSRMRRIDLTDYAFIGGQTSNGQSNYQWDGATYRNPNQWTSRLIVRRDNTSTGINGSIPALTIFNSRGLNQATAALAFAAREADTSGNSVNLAGIIAKKESAGNVNAWSPGSLHFYVKNFGQRRDALSIDYLGVVSSPYEFRAPIFRDLNDPVNYYGDFASNSRFNDLMLRGNYVRTYAHSGSDFTSGTLVRTSIPATATNGASFVLEATGKSYSSSAAPFSFIAQGYLYSNTIISYSGQHFGHPGFRQMKVFEYQGVLCFWWPRVSYWNSFSVHVRDAGGDDRNLVTSISNSTEPTGSKKQTINMKVPAVYGDDVDAGDLYASRFVDSDNGNYWADPAGQSRFNTLTLTGNRLGFIDNNFDAEIRVDDSNPNSTGARFVFWGDGTQYNAQVESEIFFGTREMRAPVFRDSDDPSNYYSDMTGTTRLNRLYINPRNDNYNVGSLNPTNATGDWQSLTNTNGQFTVTQYNAIQNYTNSPSGVYTYGSVLSTRTANHSFQLYSAHTGDLAYKTQWNNDNYSGWLTPVVYGRNGGSASGKDIYGSAFFDTDNTQYYVNPASSARLRNWLAFGRPGVQGDGRWLSIEGNADSSGEGSGRLFFAEHNSTTTDMSDYGMSFGYRGGSTSIAGADGRTWTGLSQIPNGYWALFGHNNDAAGYWAMRGFRDGAVVEVQNYIDARRFRDRDNPNNYWVEPASISYMHEIHLDDLMRHRNDTNSYIYWPGGDDFQIVAGGRQVLRMSEGTDPDRLRFVTDSNWTDSNGDWNMSRNVTVGNEVQAPIYYDSNRNWYVDPDGTSRMNVIDANRVDTDRFNGADQWYGDIIINGNENTYYPVTWFGGNQDIITEIEIYRGYAEQAPWNPIGTGVHRGGLTCLLRANFGGWGGSNYDYQFDDFRETYTTIVADITRFANNRGLCIWLRGGGSGGAIYHIRVKGRNYGPVVSYSTYDPGGNGTGVAPRTDTPQTNINNHNHTRGPDLNARNMDASVFRDRDNTGYYLDPTATTSIRTIGSWLANSGSWSGDAGSGVGKIQYHSNRWYINAGSNSTEIVRFRRGGSDMSWINNAGNLVIRNDAPTIYMRDTNHSSAMLHTNSNIFYVLRGGTDTEGWSQVNGQWPLEIHLNDNNAYFGGNVHIRGNARSFRQNSTGSWSGDAPTGVGKIEYHSNRWYLNSGVNSTELVRFRRGGSNVAMIDNSGRARFQNGGTPSYSVHGIDIYANGGWLRTSGNNGVYWESHDTRIYSPNSTYIYTRSNNGWIFQNRSSQNKGYVYHDGNSFGLLNGAGSWRVRIANNNNDVEFYGDYQYGTTARFNRYEDRNDPGNYYLDPAGTSQVNVLNASQINVDGYTLADTLTRSVAAGNWYTIAECSSGRAYATFNVWDGDSGRHGSMSFTAGISYYNKATITMLGKSWYSGGGIFRYIRIRSSSTYSRHYLQVYIESSGTIGYAMTNSFSSGNRWVLTQGPTGNPGSSTRAEVDPDAYPGLATSDHIWTGGNLYAANEVQGTIFRDRNDGNRYCDPSGTSEMQNLGLQGYLHVSKNNTTGQGIIFADDGDMVDNNDGYLGMRFSSGIYISPGNRTGNSGNWRHLLQSNGTLQSTGEHIATNFKDRDDSNYYVNPASTSRLRNARIEAGHGDTRMQLYYAHSNSSGHSHLTLWASEPGITYDNCGIGGNIDFRGQYYGREDNGNAWGAYLRFDVNNGYVEAWTTNGTAGAAGGQGTRRWYVDSNGDAWAQSSYRANRFYASNDSRYWIQPNTSSAFRLQTVYGHLDVGPMNGSYCHFQTDRGLFYFNKRVDFDGDIYAYGGNENAYFNRFIDRNDVNFFTEPGSYSYMRYIGRREHNTGFLVGSYNSVGDNASRTNPIYTIGSSYMPNAGDLSNMYGIGYSVAGSAGYVNITGASGWGMYVAADGDARVFLDGSNGRASVTGAMYSPVYYDAPDTGYYVEGAATSRLNVVRANYYSSPYSGTNSGISRSSRPYDFGFQEGGGWSNPYPDLVLQYHTGVTMAANPGYGGIRFMNDYNSGTVRFQINGTSSYTYANTWLQVGGAGVGIYDPHNGAHFLPNNATNYGSWDVWGNRSGYYGLAWSQAGRKPHIMWDGSGNGGLYLQDDGRWILYHNRGRNCTGIGSSATFVNYRMRIAGSLYCDGNVVAYSDRRKKKNIQTIENALDKVLQLRGVTYERIEEEQDEHNDEMFVGTQMGLIAQEVLEVVPEVVSYVEEADSYGLDYPKMVGLLVEAHKDQQTIINSQQDQIDELKEMVNKLMEKL